MKRLRLSRDFFAREPVAVARELLGKVLIRKTGNLELQGLIIETEAYGGKDDPASHANRGKTKRNLPMFDQAGLSYVYQIYGTHWCFNVVTGKKGEPSAVLIRAVKPLAKIVSPTDGPAKLCKAFFINQALNHIDLIESRELYFEDWGIKIPEKDIEKTHRIGTKKAEGKNQKLWRFVLKA